MVSKWVISPTYKWGMNWGYNPLILTIDPNFLRDIQVNMRLRCITSLGEVVKPVVEDPRRHDGGQIH